MLLPEVFIAFCFLKHHYYFTNASNAVKPSKLYTMTASKRFVGQPIVTMAIISETQCALLCSHYVSCMSYNVIRGSGSLRCELNTDADVDNLVEDLTCSYHGMYCYFHVFN